MMQKAHSKLLKALVEFEDLEVIGNPSVLGVSLRCKSKRFNIFSLECFLEKKGWNVTCGQHPDFIGLILTPANSKNIDDFIKTLRTAIEEIKKNPSNYQEGKAKIYASSKKCPDPSLMDDITKTVLDCYYKTKA